MTAIERKRFSVCHFSGDLDLSLADTIAFLQAQHAEIPESCRASAYCELDAFTDYDDCADAHFEVWYDRDETDEEMAVRAQTEEVERRSTLPTSVKGECPSSYD